MMLAASIVPTVETAAASGADDVAIWIHPTDTSKSTVIGAVKTSSTAIRVYNLAGQQIQSVATSQVNNIDLRYNFQLGGQSVAILTGSNRSNDSIVIFRIDPQTGTLSNVAARTISTGISIYGCAMYISPTSGKYYTFVSSESGQVQQWELFDNGAGKVDARRIRSFSVGSVAEGMVADDVLGHLYVGEENIGIWKYSAEPNGGTSRTQVDRTGSGGHLTADVEGLSIYYMPSGVGYLLASSQGNSTFNVYRRDGVNNFLGSFKLVAGRGIDAVSDTDGIDVTSVPLGPKFPQGLFVAQDNDENFKLVRWDAIASALGGLTTNATGTTQPAGRPATNNPLPVENDSNPHIPFADNTPKPTVPTDVVTVPSVPTLPPIDRRAPVAHPTTTVTPRRVAPPARNSLPSTPANAGRASENTSEAVDSAFDELGQPAASGGTLMPRLHLPRRGFGSRLG